jgi:hypothetical protein
MSIPQRLRYVIKERGGFFALYRGIAPGSLRSFGNVLMLFNYQFNVLILLVGNGSAMAVMIYLQKKVSEWGLRD